MTWLLAEFARLAPLFVRGAVAAVAAMAFVLIAQRAVIGVTRALSWRISLRYRPLIQQALGGDEAALHKLAKAPARHRLRIAWLLIEPLIADRDPQRIAMSRKIADAMSILELADPYLRSWLWWRRALGLRALGLLNARDYTPRLIAALDDSHQDVRAAALDALTDQRDPAALREIVLRLNDTSLHRGRRGAALKAFGSDCEPLLLEWSEHDVKNRVTYIQALAICGTARSRPVLCAWTRDTRLEVRATAYEALAYVGLDDVSAQVAIDGLESIDAPVRAMAAYALRGWQGPGNAAARLAAHLDDTWAVAVRAARTLQSMGQAGVLQLQARSSGPELSGLLARQMLWQPDAPR